MTIIVKAVGPSMFCPDREGAVDADLLLDGTPIGVTLLPHDDGSPGLSSWGSSLDYWVSEPALVPDQETADAIIAAVNDALS